MRVNVNQLPTMFAIVAVLWGAVPQRAAGIQVRTVALRGDIAPGTGGKLLLDATKPSINRAGHVAFHSELGPSLMPDHDTGYFAEVGQELTLVAWEGEQDPNGVVFNFLSRNSPHIYDEDRVMFDGHASGVLWLKEAGGVTLVAGPGVTHHKLAVNRHGDFAVHGRLWAGDGIYAGDVNGFDIIAREGDLAPGLTTARFETFQSPVINDSGFVAIEATLQDGPQWGIWAGTPGHLSLIALTGQQAPGFAPGVVFTDFRNLGVNNRNQVLFDEQSTGIWLSNEGTLNSVISRGDMMPGGMLGEQFQYFMAPTFNSQGDIAFMAWVNGPSVNSSNDQGAWVIHDGQVHTLLREGGQLPGALVSVRNVSDYYIPIVNDAGHIVMRAGLHDDYEGPHSRAAILAFNVEGELLNIIRHGDLLEVAPGDFRSLTEPSLLTSTEDYGQGSNGQDGRPTCLNDSGQLAFRSRFTDGTSGLFVFIVPEPSTFALTVCGLVVLLVAARRSRMIWPRRHLSINMAQSAERFTRLET